MSAPVDVLAVLDRLTTAAELAVDMNTGVGQQAVLDGLRKARAAVAELIEAARFTLEPSSHDTPERKLRDSRERLRAALALCKGGAA